MRSGWPFELDFLTQVNQQILCFRHTYYGNTFTYLILLHSQKNLCSQTIFKNVCELQQNCQKSSLLNLYRINDENWILWFFFQISVIALLREIIEYRSLKFVQNSTIIYKSLVLILVHIYQSVQISCDSHSFHKFKK